MYKFIKDLLKKKEPEKLVLPLDAVPALLDDREKALRLVLETETHLPIQNIRNASAQLQHIVNGIAGAEHDPAIHPKLKSIAKNSLPLFVRAMNASLKRDLPEDIEEFYAASVESVKGCLNSTRGQGRYLQAVFPEEMKAVKTGIDAIGHEINTITASLARFQKQKALIGAARSLHDALYDLRIDARKSLEKDLRIANRIRDTTDRISSIDKDLAELSSDARMQEVKEKKLSLSEVEMKRDERIRTYTALSMTASHVFRKAEKIATKQKLSPEISNLRHTIDLLSDHTAPDTKELASALITAFPVAQRMIDSGDIILKNKEERAIFSDTGKFSNDIFSICKEIMIQEMAWKSAQDELASHPVLMRINALDREKTQLVSMLNKEHQSKKDLAEWSERTVVKIPAIADELNQKLVDIVGGSVQLQADDLSQ
ncbi:MAG TPA: hypothetical protein VFC43_01665 [Methanoregula sp.]|nr:hypothetical protein [Methanoregula sp.]